MKVLIAVADYAYAAYLKVASYLTKQPQHRGSNIQNNQTVLLIPGVYENWYFFRRLQVGLERLGHRVVNTEKLVNSTSVLVDGGKLAKYLETNNIKSAILVGHSSGGLIALRTLQLSDRVEKVITIAAPFHGVTNGKLLRTKLVKELLPESEVFIELRKISQDKRRKVVSFYPSYDNQVWSKKGSILNGAKNTMLKSRGHHLILRSRELTSAVISELQ